jgi:hypothetical protein
MELLRTIVAGLPLLPMLLALLGGGIGAGAVTWNLRGWWFDTFTRPAIVRETQAADAAIYEQAATEARRALELKNFRVLEQLANHFYQAQQEDQAWHQAQIDQLNQEIAAYEHGSTDTGRSLTQHDIDFLGGVRDQPASAHR